MELGTIGFVGVPGDPPLGPREGARSSPTINGFFGFVGGMGWGHILLLMCRRFVSSGLFVYVCEPGGGRG